MGISSGRSSGWSENAAHGSPLIAVCFPDRRFDSGPADPGQGRLLAGRRIGLARYFPGLHQRGADTRRTLRLLSHRGSPDQNRAGASLGVLVAFVSAKSVWSVVRLPLEFALLGPRLTVARLLTTFLIPPLLAFLAQALAGRQIEAIRENLK